MSKKTVMNRLNPLFFEGIAHRGLWNEADTENGLKAFRNAIEAGFAMEFDIHLTKDGTLLVCHDDNLKRTTGKEGIIEELTLDEIKKNYRLLDGEEVPTFDELLALNHEQVPMVCELKVHKGNYKSLGKAAQKKFQETIKDKKNLWVISFDPRALLQIHGYSRSLLVCLGSPWTLRFRYCFSSLDVEDVLLNDKRVVSFRKHHPINVWTIEREEQLDNVVTGADAVTFQKLDANRVRLALKKARDLR
jgi:glycerophosphoryl diester phosphodiesterase